MWRLVLVLVFAVPLVDLWLLVQIGAAVGSSATLLLVAGAAIAGVALARGQGRRLMTAPSAHPWMEGLLVLLGGVLLVTPGVLTDLVGIPLLVPRARGWIAPRLVRRIAPGVAGVSLGDPPQDSRTATAAHPFSSPFDDLP